jgi:hypothetical protein
MVRLADVDTSTWTESHVPCTSLINLSQLQLSVFKKSCSRCCVTISDPLYLPAGFVQGPGRSYKDNHVCKPGSIAGHSIKNCPQTTVYRKNLDAASKMNNGKHKEEARAIFGEQKLILKRRRQEEEGRESDERKRQKARDEVRCVLVRFPILAQLFCSCALMISRIAHMN